MCIQVILYPDQPEKAFLHPPQFDTSNVSKGGSQYASWPNCQVNFYA